MTIPTAIATPAAPARPGAAGPDRSRKEATGNEQSFASLMRAHRGDADQGRTRGASETAPGHTKTTGGEDASTSVGSDASQAGTEPGGIDEHSPGRSALHRRDWQARLRALTSGEDRPQSAEQSDHAAGDASAAKIPARIHHRDRAANTNDLPMAVEDAAAEPEEATPKVALKKKGEEEPQVESKPSTRRQTIGSPEPQSSSDAALTLLAVDQTVRIDRTARGRTDDAKDRPNGDELEDMAARPARAASDAQAADQSASRSKSHQPANPAQAQAAHVATQNNASPSSPALTVEMTVAAANYALVSGSGSQGADTGTPETTEGVTDAETSTPAKERPRVTVLPSSPQMASPGLSSSVFGMPAAFVADDQARQSAEANGARDEIKTLRADKAADDNPRTKVEPDTGATVRTPAAPVQAQSLQQAPASPTATVVAALAAETAARAQPVSALAPVFAAPTGTEPKTLTIQLHPAELGVVYATFQMIGGQMSVEISAETDEARTRLSAESQTIAKSLRSLGIEVDQVTVMQTTTAAPGATRVDDAAAQNLPSPRDQQSSFGAQTSGGGGSRLGGQQNGRNGHDMAGSGRDQPSAADRGDGGLYI